MQFSPFSMIQLHTLSSLHLVLECTKSLSNFSACGAKVCLTSCCVFGVGLFANGRSGVVGLVSVGSSCVLVRSASLGKSPSRKILLCRWVGTGLWDIPAWADSIGGASLVLECASAASSETKCVKGSLDHLRAFLGVVLGTWGLLQTVHLHSGFGAYFGCQGCPLPAQISRNWVVKETHILIKIIFRLVSSLTFSSSK